MRLASALLLSAALAVAAFGQTALAADGTWNTANGPEVSWWNDTSNWVGGVVASGADSTAYFTYPVAAFTPVYETWGQPTVIGHMVFSGGTATGAFFDIREGGGPDTGLTLSVTTGTPTIFVSDASACKTALLETVLHGTQGFIKTGGGQLQLDYWTGIVSDYSGDTVINEGLVTINYAEALSPSTTFVINSGGSFSGMGSTLGNVATWLSGGKIATGSSGAIAIGANASYAVNMTSYSNLYLGSVDTYTMSGALTPGANGYLLSGPTMAVGEGLTVSSNLTAATGLKVRNNGILSNGEGQVSLSGTNTYTGDTTVESGRLAIKAAAAAPHGAGKGNYIVSGAGVLELRAATTINGLSGAGAVDNNFAGGATALTLGDGDANGSFSGVIKNTLGTLSLAKMGSGKETLSGVNTYAGATSVVAGILEVAGAGSINGTSGVTVDGATAKLMVNSSVALTKGVTVTKGTLGGSGTINAAVTLTADSVLSPGNSIGDLTIGSDLALAGSIEMEIDKNPTVAADLLNLGAFALTYGGTLNVTGSNVGNYAGGDSFKLFNAASYSGAFDAINLPTLSDGLSWNTSGLSTDGTIAIAGVPEPTTLALLATGLLGLLAYAWRKRK